MLLDNFVKVVLSQFTEYFSGHTASSSSCDAVGDQKSAEFIGFLDLFSDGIERLMDQLSTLMVFAL